MARFNEILAGRYNRFFQRLLSMKGGPPAPQLSSELQPNFDVHKLPVEYRFLMLEGIYGVSAQVAAVAATLSAVRLRNPANSGIVAVVEKATFATAVAQLGLLSKHAPGGVGDLTGSTSNTAGRDGRDRTSTCIFSTGNPAALAGILLCQPQLPATSTYDFVVESDQEIPIAPNEALTIWAQTVNTAMSGGFFWRERPIEEGEVS